MPHRRDVLAAVGASTLLATGVTTAQEQPADGEATPADESDGEAEPAVPAGQHLAVLTSDQEVPAVESPATGTASFAIDPRGNVHYSLAVSNVQNPTQAHIHQGAPGENGPPVVWLHPGSEPAQEPRRIAGRFDGVLHHGTFSENDFVGPLAGQGIQALVDAVGATEAYVNVHTEQHPGGEIRGQITPFQDVADALAEALGDDGLVDETDLLPEEPVGENGADNQTNDESAPAGAAGSDGSPY